jgi:5-methylcytosine-specific restriction endonuclease McrA
MTDESLPLFLFPVVERAPIFEVCFVCKQSFIRRKNAQVCCSARCRDKLGHGRKIARAERQCKHCYMPFVATHNLQVYCSSSCQKKAYRQTPQSKRYRRAVQDRRNAYQRTRLAKQSFLTRRLPYFNHNYNSHITSQDLEMLFQVQAGLCVLCAMPLGDHNCEIDHIIPVKKHGVTAINNLQLLCFMCNRGKWTASVDDYITHCTRVADFARKSSKASY